MNKDHNFRLKKFCGILFTVVVLIVLPSILGIFVFTVSYTESRLIIDPNGLVIVQVPVSYSVIIFSFAAILYIIVTAYGISPLTRGKGYLENRNSRTLVLEFVLIKNLLFIGILILTGEIIINYLILLNTPANTLKSSIQLSLLLSIFAVILGSILRYASLNVKKEFRFYFVKGCCELLKREKNYFNRIEYLFLALDSYDKYLQRRLKIEIQGLEKIISNFISSSIEQREEIIGSICKSLERDRLQLAIYLSTLVGPSETALFVRESPIHKLKVLGTILAAAIPIIISFIQLQNDLAGTE